MNGFDGIKMNPLSSGTPITSLSSSIGMAINSQITASAVNHSNNNTNSVNASGFNSNTITNNSSNSSNVCCLIEDNQRCQRTAGNASYSKRIEKQVTQRKLKLKVESGTAHTYICEHHKQMIQSIRSSGKRKRKDSEDDNSNDVESDSHVADVDLLALQVNALRRYKRHYRIQTRPGLNKSQLAETLMRHFKSIPIYEKEAITYFIYMVKCNKNKLDHITKGAALPLD